MKALTIDDIKKFKTNKIDNNILNEGLFKGLLNKDIIDENPNEFNIELPSRHLYDQYNSGRCWCVSSINMIENNIIENMNIRNSDLALSINYISFFDKLEKANFIYNYVIDNNCDIAYLNTYLLNNWYGSLSEGSYYTNFANIINKYGLVPSSIMPETECSNNSDELMKIFKEKVKKDSLTIFKQKNKKNKKELYKIKQKKLNEVYNLLVTCLGEIPFLFDYSFKDKLGNTIKLENITPLEFKNKYLTLRLEDFIYIVCNPNLEYYKKYYKEISSHNSNKPYLEFINLPKNEMKRLVIKQLKNNIPVKFVSRISLSLYKDINVLDTRLIDFNKLGDYILNYKEGIKMQTITSEHAMVIEGVYLDNDKPLRWKVENSHKDNGKQFYIMNDNYFDSYVININIYKDFLSRKQKEILELDPIKVSNYEVS